MGISGLYTELGPGERTSLSKLAADHFEKTGKRLRLAVDASIWSFQVQAGKGGSNPALRTLYYRLTRLLALNITPLFIFDGPHRPAFKRNHKTNAHLTPALSRLTKNLLKLFGFPFHSAPGEAEAECAVLQKEGIVDAVLSEDVDTIMFGSGKTLRNWSGEGSKSKTPTHVTVYNQSSVEMRSGLTPNGMILVALMSGGDYLPQGVPGCGIKTAAEAAKAGFGEDLCVLDEDDEEGLKEWRQRLEWELEGNESGWFKRKHKAVKIPVDFPDRTVLGYYTNPVVSSSAALQELRRELRWDQGLDVAGLRELTREAFEWRATKGAKKFIRSLAAALLSWKLCRGSIRDKRELEKLVESFHGKREHFSTGGCKELRISFTPGQVVQVNMDAEAEDDDDDNEQDQPDNDDEEPQAEEDAPSGRKSKEYDPFVAERIWVLEIYVKAGVAEKVTEWENPKSKLAKPTSRTTATTRARKTKEIIQTGAMEKYLKVSKATSQNIVAGKTPEPEERQRTPLPTAKMVFGKVSKTVAREKSTSNTPNDKEYRNSPLPPVSVQRPLGTKSTKATAPTAKKIRAKPSTKNHLPSMQTPTNPRPQTPRPASALKVTPPRFSALGVYNAPLPPSLENLTLNSPSPSRTRDIITIISSSPSPSPLPQPPTTPRRRHRNPQKTTTSPRHTRSSDTSDPENHSRTVKKRTPTKIRDTPSTQIRRALIVLSISSSEEDDEEESKKVNRRLDFVTPSLPSHLPSSPPPPVSSMVARTKKSTKCPTKPRIPTTEERKGPRKVVLRDSFSGEWGFVDNEDDDSSGNGEEGKRERKGWSCVEVVDLTGDD